MLISLIIPTYNEAENIPDLIDKISNILKQESLDREVIIEDDDSPDRTWDIAEKLKSKDNILFDAMKISALIPKLHPIVWTYSIL